MLISDEEQFALLLTLDNHVNNLDALLDGAKVTERNRTGIGFFSTVILRFPLHKNHAEERYWEINFEHKRIPYGGCFMVSQASENTLEIEAAAFESKWPEPFVREEFLC